MQFLMAVLIFVGLGIIIMLFGMELVAFFDMNASRFMSKGVYMIKCPEISQHLRNVAWPLSSSPCNVFYNRSVLSPHEQGAGELCMLLGLKYAQLTRHKHFCVDRIVEYTSTFPEQTLDIFPTSTPQQKQQPQQPWIVIAKSDDVRVGDRCLAKDMLLTQKGKIKLAIRGSAFVVVLMRRLNVQNY